MGTITWGHFTEYSLMWTITRGHFAGDILPGTFCRGHFAGNILLRGHFAYTSFFSVYYNITAPVTMCWAFQMDRLKSFCTGDILS